MLWLIDNGLGQLAADSVIYYGHKEQFCFGWRKPLSAGEVSRLLDVISEFALPYEIKCEGGRPLSG